MGDVYIATLQLANSIPRLPYDRVSHVELYDREVQVRQVNKVSAFMNSFTDFVTVSFIEIPRVPIWYYAGKPFSIYTEDAAALAFFKSVVSLTFGKNIGLLVKGGGSGGSGIGGDTLGSREELKKDDFYLMFYVDADFNIKAVPLQVSNTAISQLLKNSHTEENVTESHFVEPISKHEDILNKFAERKQLNPFLTSTSSINKKPIVAPVTAVPAVPSVNLNVITDYELFKRTILNFVNSELRMRNIPPSSKDHQLLINNVFKSVMFAFRAQLKDRSSMRIKADDIREMVIKLMDIFV